MHDKRIQWLDLTFPPINLYNVPRIYKPMKIVIYTSANCKFCESAKTLCKENGLAFTTVDLQPLEARDEFAKAYGFVPRSVPQVVVDDKVVGSFDAFKAFLTTEVN